MTEGAHAAGRGQSLVVVANRLPVQRQPPGRWVASPGGLVSALHPLLSRQGGAWVGWHGTPGPAPAPFTTERVEYVPVGLSRSEARAHYAGFSNRTIWPLYHDVIRPPTYHRAWWPAYRAVNERFAARAAEVAAPRATVWVQDYHLQLVPAMLRARRPDVRIGFFLHVPFPPAGIFAQLPWRGPVLEGLLGADVVGLQVPGAAENLLQAVRAHLGLRAQGSDVPWGGRRVRVGAFPISIDVARYDEAARSPRTARQAEFLRRRLGPGRRVLLGVDRLDYTKGIELRLKAYGDALSRGLCRVEDAVLVQAAVPSRERVAEYREVRRSVEALVGQVNGEYGQIGRAAVHYVRRNHALHDLVSLYRAADVMLVTPQRDGMNLVAKEYVAARHDESGVLVLSEFAGASHELADAVLVNPHDVDGTAEAIGRALAMPPGEQARRMRSLRAAVARNTVHDWARSFLEALVP